MAEPKALSLSKIAGAARTSVQRASKDHKLPIDAIHTVGYFPPRHWLGFVIYKPKIDEFNLGDAERLAKAVHSGIGKEVAGGSVGVSLDGDLLTLGFAPPPDINVLEP